MKEFIDKLIERLEEKAFIDYDEYYTDGGECLISISDVKEIANELAEEYKEECNLDCDKLLFAYSDLLRRFQNAEGTVICEFSGNISKEIEELEEECNELLSQFKEILYSSDSTQKSVSGWIPCSERLPEVNGWYLVTNELGVVQQQHWGASHWEKLRDEAVLAWMPLPAPYTEGE